jgi:hypothetical protein
MKQRNVDPNQVEETLEFPDEIMPGDNGEEIAIKQYGNREVRVVYEQTGAETIVIYTVMKPKVKQL